VLLYNNAKQYNNETFKPRYQCIAFVTASCSVRRLVSSVRINTAVGCADVVPPENVWWKRSGDGANATFGCIGRTTPVQRMTCVGSDWHSDVTPDSIDCPHAPQTGATSMHICWRCQGPEVGVWEKTCEVCW